MVVHFSVVIYILKTSNLTLFFAHRFDTLPYWLKAVFLTELSTPVGQCIRRYPVPVGKISYGTAWLKALFDYL